MCGAFVFMLVFLAFSFSSWVASLSQLHSSCLTQCTHFISHNSSHLTSHTTHLTQLISIHLTQLNSLKSCFRVAFGGAASCSLTELHPSSFTHRNMNLINSPHPTGNWSWKSCACLCSTGRKMMRLLCLCVHRNMNVIIPPHPTPPTPPTKPEMAGSQHQCARMTALCARMTRFLCARMTRLQCAQMTRFQRAQMTRWPWGSLPHACAAAATAGSVSARESCSLQTLGLPAANPAYALTCSNPCVGRV